MPAPTHLFLGIDGGQSSTTAYIGDANGRVIGWSKAGPCNHVSDAESAAKFERVIGECIADACALAALEVRRIRFAAACCGMSGGPEDKAEILARIVAADRLLVTNDAETGLMGALEGEPGVFVVAGTGSIALGRDATGSFRRAGGWGYIFGDDGGAFDIARQALRAALRFEEGWGSPTTLHTAFLGSADVETANALLHRFYTADWPRSRVAQLAIVVDFCSQEGDSVARAIMEQAAQNLASLASSVRARLSDKVARVSYSGGVFKSEIVLERFVRIVELTGDCECIPPVLDPAGGALLLAYRAHGSAVKLSEAPLLK